MDLVAINSSTGKVMLSLSGSMGETEFRKMIAANFPSVPMDRIIFIRDGQVLSGNSTAPKRPSNKEIIWKGSFWDLGGYANMNREICLRLIRHGFSMKVEVLPTGMQIDGSTLAAVKALESTRLKDERSAIMVVGFTPMPIQRRCKKTVFFTMMETQGLHQEFVNRCNQSANEIWVPCHFYEMVFKQNGVVRPIKVIPLGINQELYVPGKTAPILPYDEMPLGKRAMGLPENKFKFMSLFGWSYRKGTDILCRSFIREFSSSDDVCLVIYSRYMGSSADQHKEYVRNEIRGYYDQEKKKDPPTVYYCGECIPISDLPGCYGSSDAFVFCSRGEGFCLPVCEAGACGIPVISAYNTAMTEYLDDNVSYPVRPSGYAPANDKLTWISEYYRNQNFAVMGEEQIEEFGRLMRRVRDNPEEASGKAAKFRERILGTYTWDHCADRVAKCLDSLI